MTQTTEPGYGPEHASIYDDLYAGRGKDYAAESLTIGAEIVARNPDAASLLDVGCGTGNHLRFLRRRFRDVSGVEPSASMRAIALTRLDAVTIHDGDMQTLATGRTYDAVICLFSVIGYASSLDIAIARMSAHLNPGGVLIVEPWRFPEDYEVGHVGSDYSRTDRRTIFRMSHSGLIGQISVLTMNYLVGDADGVRHFKDVHLLALHERAEYEQAFIAADCSVTYLSAGGFGRGLFVGVRHRPT